MRRRYRCSCPRRETASSPPSAHADTERRSAPASPAAAAPTRGCASPRGILRRCGGRCRYRLRAACRRWCRRTVRRSALSASISCLMRWRTASAECASPPSDAAIAEVKKYFSSKMPRGVAMNLLAVTRETVDLCMPMASATVRRLSGRRCWTPWAKKRVLLAHDLGRDLEDGARPLVERAHQPGGVLQAVGEIGFFRRRCAPTSRPRHSRSGSTQHARQRVGVELDQPAAVRTGAHHARRAPPAAPAPSRRRDRASD